MGRSEVSFVVVKRKRKVRKQKSRNAAPSRPLVVGVAAFHACVALAVIDRSLCHGRGL